MTAAVEVKPSARRLGGRARTGPVRLWVNGATLGCAFTVAACGGAPGRPSPGSSAGVAQRLSLVDSSTGRDVLFDALRGKAGTVVVFSGLSCPVALGYEGDLIELSKKLGPKGINVVDVNSNANESVDQVRRHASTLAFPFPIYKDPRGGLAKVVAAQVQSESVLLDRDNRVVYRGRIDDRLSLAIKRLVATHHELLDAAEALLAGQTVPVPQTQASGCGISFHEERTVLSDDVTYVRDVAPILQRHCADCHRPNQIGPMPFLTYEDVTEWSGTIRRVVEARTMPPWDLSGADPSFGDFTNDRGLSSAERSTLLRWIDDGAPRGAGDEPTVQFDNDEWAIGRPDLVLSTPGFDVPAQDPKEGIPYQHFEIYENTGERRWVQAIEVRPGVRSVVHHAGLLMSAPNVVPLLPRGDRWTVAAPGRWAQTLPEGMARALPPGAKIELEIHYTPDGVAHHDQTLVGIRFARSAPRREVMIASVGNTNFEVPPNAPSYEVEASFRVPGQAALCAMVPHMHFRGKDFRIDAVTPDGVSKTLLFVPHYDYNWQHRYVPKQPISLPGGTLIREVAHFDNSAANPGNPDPNVAIRWGEQSWDEMMYGFLELAFDEDVDSPRLSELREATKVQLPHRPK